MKKKHKQIIKLSQMILGILAMTLFLANVSFGEIKVVLEEHFEDHNDNKPPVRNWTYPDTDGTVWQINDDDSPNSGNNTANCADKNIDNPDTPEIEEYAPGTYSSIQIQVDLTNHINTQLEFRYKVEGEANFDYGWVEIEDEAIAPSIVKYYHGDISGRDVPWNGYSNPEFEDEMAWQTAWQNETLYLSEFDNRIIKLTFRFLSGHPGYEHSDDTTNEYRGFYIDDVKLTGNYMLDVPKPPINPSPSNDSTDITLTTALSWEYEANSNVDEVQVKFGTDEMPETIIQNFGAGPITSLTNQAIVTGWGELEGNTTYYWNVTVKNASTGITTQRTFRFTTACVPESVFPYEEGFEDDWTNAPLAPPCWTQKENQDNPSYWENINVGPHSGARCASGPANYPDGGTQDLITPPFILNSDAFKLKFWLKGSEISGTDLHVFIGKINPSGDFVAFNFMLTEDSLDKLQTDIGNQETFEALQELLVPLMDIDYTNETDFKNALYAQAAADQSKKDLINANIDLILIHASAPKQKYIAGSLVSAPDIGIPTEWEEQVIDLSAYSGYNYDADPINGEPVLIKFKLVNTNGNNNLYIDDVSVYEIHDKDSDIEAGDDTEPSEISSTIDTENERFNVFDVKFNDNGSGDSEASEINKVTFTQGAANEVSDWTTAIAGATLYGPDGEQEGTINENSIVFEDIEKLISVDDGQSETYQLKIWLQKDLAGISDNDKLAFKLTYDNVNTDIISSRFGSGDADSGAIAIGIHATKLVFITEPHYNAVEDQLLYIAPVVAAQDDNGNLDTDYAEKIYLSNSSGLNTSKNWATAEAGIATFSGFQFTETGGRTILKTAPGALEQGISTVLILVTDPPKIIRTFTFELDDEWTPQWTLAEEFEIAEPSGLGGSSGNKDPDSAYAGDQVLGTDLTGLNANSGDCEPDLGDKAWTATSPVIDCSDHARVGLMFYRWLNTQTTDHAYIEVSNNGTDWTEVYSSDDEVTNYKLTQASLIKLDTDLEDETFIPLQLLLVDLMDIEYDSETEFIDAIYSQAGDVQDNIDLINENKESILTYAGYIFEDAWSFHEIDISYLSDGTTPLADGKSQVQIRFSYGGSDSTEFYSGWNIDQLQIIERPQAKDMEHEYSQVIQNNTDYVVQGWKDQEIIGIQVITNHTANPLTLSELRFNIHGTSEYTDIETAKVYYTGLNSTFSADITDPLISQLFGSTDTVPADGGFTITGNQEQELQGGVNYFWLAYDVRGDATPGNVLDGECPGLTINTNTVPMSIATDGDGIAPGRRKILKEPELEDVIYILLILTGNDEVAPSYSEILLDYTANDKVDMGDALFVMEYLAGLRPF